MYVTEKKSNVKIEQIIIKLPIGVSNSHHSGYELVITFSNELTIYIPTRPQNNSAI